MTRRRQGAQIKRFIDVLDAAVGLVVLSPVLVLSALAVLMTEGPPIFFRHLRPGLRVHAPPHADHSFRTKLITGSAACRSLIPDQADEEAQELLWQFFEEWEPCAQGIALVGG